MDSPPPPPRFDVFPFFYVRRLRTSSNQVSTSPQHLTQVVAKTAKQRARERARNNSRRPRGVFGRSEGRDETAYVASASPKNVGAAAVCQTDHSKFLHRRLRNYYPPTLRGYCTRQTRPHRRGGTHIHRERGTIRSTKRSHSLWSGWVARLAFWSDEGEQQQLSRFSQKSRSKLPKFVL